MTPDNNSNEAKKQIKTILGELAGYASLCWEPKPVGVFDSTKASIAVQLAYEKILDQKDSIIAELREKVKGLTEENNRLKSDFKVGAVPVNILNSEAYMLLQANYDSLKLQIGRLEKFLKEIKEANSSIQYDFAGDSHEVSFEQRCMAISKLLEKRESIYCQDPNCSGHCGKLKEWKP